jgi:catechol 2,3-dioxygenase-like lactoylglutathione lyase family enzyme
MKSAISTRVAGADDASRRAMRAAADHDLEHDESGERDGADDRRIQFTPLTAEWSHRLPAGGNGLGCASNSATSLSGDGAFPMNRRAPSDGVRDRPYHLGVRRVVGVEPIFVVSDVPRAVAHYEQLGFSTSHHDEGYAFAHRNELTIHLAGLGVDPERVGRGSIYMHVDDADALAEEWRGAGVDFVEPQDYEYGKREGSHEDPDGNLIRFGSPLRR